MTTYDEKREIDRLRDTVNRLWCLMDSQGERIASLEKDLVKRLGGNQIQTERMTPERAREIALKEGISIQDVERAIIAGCAEERRAALTEAATLCREWADHWRIIALRDKDAP